MFPYRLIFTIAFFFLSMEQTVSAEIRTNGCAIDNICNITASVKHLLQDGSNRSLPYQELLRDKERFVSIDTVATDLSGWFMITVENNESIAVERAISINEAGLRFVRFLKQDGSQFDYGLSAAQSAREFFNPRPITQVFLEPNQNKTIFVYVEKAHNRNFKFEISSLPTILKHSLIDTLAIYLYLGIVFSMLVYQLFLYFSFKDGSHLIYVVFCFWNGGYCIPRVGQFLFSSVVVKATH